MVGQHRGEFAVLARGHAAKVTELTVEMWLIAVTRLQSHVDRRGTRFCGHPMECTLKPL